VKRSTKIILALSPFLLFALWFFSPWLLFGVYVVGLKVLCPGFSGLSKSCGPADQSLLAVVIGLVVIVVVWKWKRGAQSKRDRNDQE
jgi:hypothetical protein